MAKRKKSIFEIKRKISEYKKRLRNLKLQGFYFSKNIYEELNSIEEKISQESTLSRILKNRELIVGGIIFILIVSITTFVLFWAPENPTPQITIDYINAFEGMEFLDSRYINGTASILGDSSINIKNFMVQFRIDNQSGNASIEIRENETYTVDWGFFLNISKINNSGTYTLSVICFDGKDLSHCNNINVTIEKPRPQVSISFPKNNSIDLNGLINISGYAKGEFSEIQEVKIQIDKGTEENTFFNGNKTNWYYKWDTTYVDNGPHSISVRSYDGEKWSKNFSINFTVFNLENWIPPDFQENESFQFVIRDIYHVMVPGKTYPMYGAHRCKNDPWLSFLPLHSYLKFPNKPVWLLISLENDHFVTQRNGKIHYFTFNISITKDAEQGVYGNQFLGWKVCYGTFDFIAKKCKYFATDDIWIKTGQW